jgi:RNA polymerase sigma-70 factor, ECF subfamily
MPGNKSVVPVKGVISIVWLRSCGKEVAPVIERRTSAWITSERDGKHLVCDSDSTLILLKEEENAGWRRLTLKLYDSLSPKLVQFLWRLGLNKEEIDDVIQESFLRLAGHLKEGRSDENLPSWIYRVARNLAMDVHRLNRRKHEHEEVEFKAENEPIDPNANPERVYLRKEQNRRLRAALSQLTSQQYSSILLRAQGLHYCQIGKTLGVSEQRAIYLVKRALQQLVGGQ